MYSEHDNNYNNLFRHIGSAQLGIFEKNILFIKNYII